MMTSRGVIEDMDERLVRTFGYLPRLKTDGGSIYFEDKI